MGLALNARAKVLADHLEAHAEACRVQVHRSSAGARIIDCGIKAPGGIQVGLLLARICLADCAEVSLGPGIVPELPCPWVNVATDHPVQACMASQYAGWQISIGKFFAMASGPMRALYGSEGLFQKIQGKEKAADAVGILETRKLPDDVVIAHICEKLELPPRQLTLLIAPTASAAGTLQVVARSVETALHKLYELGFDLNQIRSGFGTAPLPPSGQDDLQAIGRTNDAILYGSRVVLWVDSDPELLAGIGPEVPSSASPDYGSPFAAIFERYQRDFYKIDPMLFSPAQVIFFNLRTGTSAVEGKLAPEILERSFFSQT
jgi:methenyltetrahydromethanopterin cyclohydrolase